MSLRYQQFPMTYDAALIKQAYANIPNEAKVSLDKYAIGRVKELGLGTKSFKYTFPFYEVTANSRAFNKVFSLMKAQLVKNIPYIASARATFVDTGRPSESRINVRIGPVSSFPRGSRAVVDRYLRYLNYHIVKGKLPILITNAIAQFVEVNKASRVGSLVN
jgi:hypothetical protein